MIHDTKFDNLIRKNYDSQSENFTTHESDNLRPNYTDNNKSFEDIKHVDENGIEFWYARELMPILQYSNWQNFEKIINKAKISCENSDISILDHFTDVNKMVQIGSGAYREQIDYELTRYACYLIAQNGDSRKKVIALAQTYFAVQTRKQEITEKEYSSLTENKKRLYQRNLTKKRKLFT